jgi:hypothetical protein
VPINGQTNKENMLSIYTIQPQRTEPGHLQETGWNCSSSCKENKSDSERQAPHVISHMWNPGAEGEERDNTRKEKERSNVLSRIGSK